MSERTKNRNNELIRYTLPPLLWMALNFTSSSSPSYDFPQVHGILWPKLVHVIFFSTLSFLTWRALQHHAKRDWAVRHAGLTAFAVAILYGMIDEFHQLYTAGRHPRMTDVLIDGASAGLFLLALSLYRSMKNIDDAAF